MSVVHRRIFYGKVGTAQELVQHMQAGNELMAKHGGEFTTKILTDNMTGRSDRVVVEWEKETMADIESLMAAVMSNPQAQAEFGVWSDKLNSLIHYAEGENWLVH